MGLRPPQVCCMHLYACADAEALASEARVRVQQGSSPSQARTPWTVQALQGIPWGPVAAPGKREDASAPAHTSGVYCQSKASHRGLNAL